MEENIRRLFKETWGISDEDLEKILPRVQRGIPKFLGMGPFRIIAEVTEAKYCRLGVKKGDKIVLDGGVVNARESTCPLCIRALGPIMTSAIVLSERLVEDLDPEESPWVLAECLDPGIDHGGIGKVRFYVKAFKTGFEGPNA